MDGSYGTFFSPTTGSTDVACFVVSEGYVNLGGWPVGISYGNFESNQIIGGFALRAPTATLRILWTRMATSSTTTTTLSRIPTDYLSLRILMLAMVTMYILYDRLEHYIEMMELEVPTGTHPWDNNRYNEAGFTVLKDGYVGITTSRGSPVYDSYGNMHRSPFTLNDYDAGFVRSDGDVDSYSGGNGVLYSYGKNRSPSILDGGSAYLVGPGGDVSHNSVIDGVDSSYGNFKSKLIIVIY